MARLAKGAETSISMAFLVMCAEKIRRLLLLFFVFISAWFYAWQRPASSWVVLMHIWRLVTSEQLITASPNSMALYRLVLGFNQAAGLIAFFRNP
jgi:transposase, IS5 family